MKRLFIFLLLTICYLLAIGNAFAADFDLGVSPPVTHITIQPGKKYLHTINIQNFGAYDVQITPKIVDFVSDQKSGHPTLLDDTTFSYVELQNTEKLFNTPFLLKSGERDQLVLSFDIPENAQLKEHHLSVLFKADPVFTLSQKSLIPSFQGTSASHIIVTINDTHEDQGELEIESFQAPVLIDSFQPMHITLKAKNVGKTVTNPQGSLEIKNMLQQTAKTFTILPENILPQSSRKLHAAQATELNNEHIFTPTEFVYRPLFAIGMYSLELTLHSPNQEPTIVKNTVIAIPFSLIILITIGSFIFIIYSYLTNIKKED